MKNKTYLKETSILKEVLRLVRITPSVACWQGYEILLGLGIILTKNHSNHTNDAKKVKKR